VASKGGTTEAAFNVLKKEDVAKKFILATEAARLRAKELSELA
jgi:pyrroline-5-carboxylate reductase